MGLLLLQGSSDLNPRELFASGEQGLWLDPSDFSTMWQDAAGDTPVTAASDPVALILDKSRSGPNMGSNQVTNGGFGADSDWTKGTGWTIGSGVATKTAGSASLLSQAQTMTAGRYCIVTYTITRTAGSITPQFAGGTTVPGTARSTSGTFTDIMTVVSGNNTLQFSADASFAGTVDNVSLKELSAGNHAYQSTSGQRPTLAKIPSSGRRNLITYTEQMDNAAWQKVQTGTALVPVITPNTAIAPDGTLTADTVVFDLNGGSDISQLQQAPTITSQQYTWSFYAKTTDGTSKAFQIAGPVGSGSDITITGDWQRFSQTGTGSGTCRVRLNGAASTAIAASIYIWGAQLETGSTATSYQKVGSTHDVSESGFSDLYHLSFDGSDDSLVTNAVDFSATDEMTVIAGVRRNGTGTGMILEHTPDLNSNNGAFYIYTDTLERTLFGSRGTTAQSKHSGTITTPYTVVKTLATDISAPSITGRVNGAVVATDASTQGTGNYANAAFYIGRRGGSSLPFTGHIYQLIIRGRTTPTGKLLEAERFVARRTGVTGI